MSEEQTPPGDKEWWTTNQVMEKYGVSQSTVQRWFKENKVISKKVGHLLYITRPSVDAHLVRLKEERKQREAAMVEARKAQAVGMVSPVIDQDEVAKLTKQLQDSNYENGRLKGSLEVYEKELGRLHTLIKELVVPQR